MAQEIVVVEGPNRFGKAYVRRRDIKYGWGKYHPTSINVLQTGGGTVGTVVGGAVVGTLLTGGIGGIVGAVAGSRAGRTSFIVETVEGKQLVCQCPNKHYPGVYAAVTKMLPPTERARVADGSGNAVAAAVAEPTPSPQVVGPRSQVGCFTWLVRAVVVVLLLFVLLVVIVATLSGPPPSP